MKRYKIGQKVNTTLGKIEIRNMSDAHGLCYLIRLSRRDYMVPAHREIWLDEDELLSIAITKPKIYERTGSTGNSPSRKKSKA